MHMIEFLWAGSLKQITLDSRTGSEPQFLAESPVYWPIRPPQPPPDLDFTFSLYYCTRGVYSRSDIREVTTASNLGIGPSTMLLIFTHWESSSFICLCSRNREKRMGAFQVNTPSHWRDWHSPLRSIMSCHVFEASLYTHLKSNRSCFFLNMIISDIW